MVNRDKIIEGIKLILEGMGEDIHREGLKDTPLRVARMYEEELFSGLYEDASVHMQTRFHVEDNQMIMERIFHFILCVNIICCLSLEMFILHMFQMEKY